MKIILWQLNEKVDTLEEQWPRDKSISRLLTEDNEDQSEELITFYPESRMRKLHGQNRMDMPSN